jgi:hypothetical protein
MISHISNSVLLAGDHSAISVIFTAKSESAYCIHKYGLIICQLSFILANV